MKLEEQVVAVGLSLIYKPGSQEHEKAMIKMLVPRGELSKEVNGKEKEIKDWEWWVFEWRALRD